MKLLLDTHALLWWLIDDAKLGQRARDLIASPDNAIMVSAASLWEIAVKVRIGKLEVDTALVAQALDREGFEWLGITPHHLTVLRGLPLYPDHRDPFDHLLVAQAIAEAATFVSDDRNTPRYPVRFIPCSDPTPAAPPR